MKTARLSLWVPLPPPADRGQKNRPCLCEYKVNSLGAKTLYSITSITDAHTKEVYPLEQTLALNEEDLSERIAAASPTQRKFAQKELGVTFGAKKPVVKKPVVKKVEDDGQDFMNL
jgi:hypothetical protein